MEEFIENENQYSDPITDRVTDNEINTDEMELVVRRKEVLNTVLEKLINKINEPKQDDNVSKRRIKH